jgi:GNAT superfamily N-acetyltransferase
MASTERQRSGIERVHALGPEHLAACQRLSAAASWNQNDADWRVMLQMGHGWGLSLDGELVASALSLPYGTDFGWISMVLVLPEQRRKGYATRLLHRAIADLESAGCAQVLDATPAGRAVYRQEGFSDTWGFRRFALRKSALFPGARDVRPIGEADWPRILDLDREAFGASREALLRSLAGRLPGAALTAEGSFLLGREGRESVQLGPLVARDPETAKALLLAGLKNVPAPLYVDVADHAVGLHALLEQAGFEFQRPFTRMVRGRAHAPGDATRVYLVAGPELG